MGQVGLEWSVAGIAADPPSGAVSANNQLVQAMASFAPTTAGNNSPLAPSSTIASPGPMLTIPQTG